MGRRALIPGGNRSRHRHPAAAIILSRTACVTGRAGGEGVDYARRSRLAILLVVCHHRV